MSVTRTIAVVLCCWCDEGAAAHLVLLLLLCGGGRVLLLLGCCVCAGDRVRLFLQLLVWLHAARIIATRALRLVAGGYRSNKHWTVQRPCAVWVGGCSVWCLPDWGVVFMVMAMVACGWEQPQRAQGVRATRLEERKR